MMKVIFLGVCALLFVNGIFALENKTILLEDFVVNYPNETCRNFEFKVEILPLNENNSIFRTNNISISPAYFNHSGLFFDDKSKTYKDFYYFNASGSYVFNIEINDNGKVMSKNINFVIKECDDKNDVLSNLDELIRKNGLWVFGIILFILIADVFWAFKCRAKK